VASTQPTRDDESQRGGAGTEPIAPRPEGEEDARDPGDQIAAEGAAAAAAVVGTPIETTNGQMAYN
jgi:hypothetical protein